MRFIRFLRPMLVASIAVLTGCGFTGGKLLFFSGLFQNKKVEAEFHLTEGPLLILIDDPREVVDWPVALRLLQDDLAQELLRNNAAKKIVPPQTLLMLRQTHPDLSKRGCREVGKMAGADQVLWIQIQDFLVDETLQSASDAAYMVATVKVIDTKSDDKWKVRAWPDNPAGRLFSVRLPADKVHRAEKRDAITKELTVLMAETIARPFYTHRPPDFERPS